MAPLIGCFSVLFVFGLIATMFSVSPIVGWISLIGFLVGGSYLVNQHDKKVADEKKSKVARFDENIRNLKDFKVSQKFVGYDLNSAILVDDKAKKICIFYDENEYKKFDYKDILESEIVEDGLTVTKTSRSSQIGGALLGGVLAGGVGAIIGGLSGSSSSQQEVLKVDLKVVLNDIDKPVALINFLTADVIDLDGKPFPIKKDDIKYTSKISEANHWHGLISVLIRQADDEDKRKEKAEKNFNNIDNNNQSLSVADELKKLHNLVKEGILTQEQFDAHREKLLG